jgi:hypothetical protein
MENKIQMRRKVLKDGASRAQKEEEERGGGGGNERDENEA